jgi:hypothetical protein
MLTYAQTLSAETRKTLRHIVPPNQLRFIQQLMRGEEGEYFAQALLSLESSYNALPIIGGPESDQPAEIAVATIHLFHPSCDWWIVERDEDPTEPVFGIADMGDRELGYISLSEILASRMVEVDLHWKPKTVAQIMSEAR